MRRGKGWRWGWAGVAVLAAGCVGPGQPSALPPPPHVTACLGLPKPARDHVYIFLINGLDLYDRADLMGLRKYLVDLGFNRVYHGQMYHQCCLEKEILAIAGKDDVARFVVIGFSHGAHRARALAEAVGAAGVRIDLLVYLSAQPMSKTPCGQPANVGRVVNVVTCGRFEDKAMRGQADNVYLPDVAHWGAPSHPGTQERLAQELIALAGTVPYVQPPLRRATELPGNPAAPPEGPRDEWDFLLPVPRLNPSAQPEPLPAPRKGAE